MSFAPKYPEIMPQAFIEAVERIHGQRYKKRRGSYSGVILDPDLDSPPEPYIKSLFEVEETRLLSISESVEVATAVAKLEKAISINPEFWEQLVTISLDVWDQIRTSDKRTNREKVEKLENIKASLEQTSKLIEGEAYGKWSPGMSRNELFEKNRPYDQLLLADIDTRPVRISLAIDAGESGDLDFHSRTASVSSGSVSKLCDALSKNIADLIKEIRSAENEFHQLGYPDRRYFEARLSAVFEDSYPDIRTRKFVIARAQTVVALAKAILKLGGDIEDLALQFSAIRRDRLMKKNRQI